MKQIAGAAIAAIITALSDGLPDPLLLVLIAICMVADFITGVFHAKAKKKAITSFGFRRTIAKFTQYGGALVIGLLLTVMVNRADLQGIEAIIPYLSDSMAVFIIYIESISILENLIGMDEKSMMSNVLRPLKAVLTFEITKLSKGAE